MIVIALVIFLAVFYHYVLKDNAIFSEFNDDDL